MGLITFIKKGELLISNLLKNFLIANLGSNWSYFNKLLDFKLRHSFRL
jgi:hypothetical protein